MNESTVYLKQVNLVLDHIHRNLDDSLSLERLSAIAGFSPYHFHRLFKLIVSETLHQYVNRVRIEKACRLLVSRPNLSLTDIGLDCGFSSIAGFSRTFKLYHRMSPSEYRSCFHHFQPREVTHAEEYYRHRMRERQQASETAINETITWALQYVHTARVTHMPPVKAAVVRHRGLSDLGLEQKASDAFDQAYDLAGKYGMLPHNPEVFGVSYDDPYITPPERCRYDACVTVLPQTESREELEIKMFPGGKYAVLDISGTIPLLWLLSGLLTQHWLPQSGYQLDDRPFIEKHFNNPLHDPNRHYRGQWCLPLRSK
ncbi:AraC family transcriptional regulator [Paenibacillus kobensis]|uniref:AraC family transcriptional regulator n=1 Tax=Paenibacillus kobensis TaxID=59841 RepID=UPI0013E2C18F|nr:GyrI-like domain-containing protein [Paenibacillus kobensis]